jgi:hypothetical protein
VSDNFQTDPAAGIISRAIATINATARKVALLSLPEAYPGTSVGLPSAEQPASPSTGTTAHTAVKATAIKRTQKGRPVEGLQAVSAEGRETVVPLLSDDNTMAQKRLVERACDACRQRCVIFLPIRDSIDFAGTGKGSVIDLLHPKMRVNTVCNVAKPAYIRKFILQGGEHN